MCRYIQSFEQLVERNVRSITLSSKTNCWIVIVLIYTCYHLFDMEVLALILVFSWAVTSLQEYQ